jgi:hypothetical protein
MAGLSSIEERRPIPMHYIPPTAFYQAIGEFQRAVADRDRSPGGWRKYIRLLRFHDEEVGAADLVSNPAHSQFSYLEYFTFETVRGS